MRYLLVLVTAALLSAAGEMNLTVAQLIMFIRSSVQLKQPDRQVAEYLRHVKLTDKLEDRTIEDLQANLDKETFWRVHRSYLVNIHKIKEVVPWFKSSYQLRMDDKKQTEIPVSRVQTKRLRELLKL